MYTVDPFQTVSSTSSSQWHTADQGLRPSPCTPYNKPSSHYANTMWNMSPMCARQESEGGGCFFFLSAPQVSLRNVYRKQTCFHGFARKPSCCCLPSMPDWWGRGLILPTERQETLVPGSLARCWNSPPNACKGAVYTLNPLRCTISPMRFKFWRQNLSFLVLEELHWTLFYKGGWCLGLVLATVGPQYRSTTHNVIYLWYKNTLKKTIVLKLWL